MTDNCILFKAGLAQWGRNLPSGPHKFTRCPNTIANSISSWVRFQEILWGVKKQYVDESDFKTDVCLMNPARSATKNYSSWILQMIQP